MKLKLRQLVEAENELVNYLSQIKMWYMDSDISRPFFKAFRVAKEELQDYKERRDSLVKELAFKNEDGTPMSLPNGTIIFGHNEAEALKRHNEILDEEIEIDFKKMPESLLDGRQLPADFFEKLEWLFEEKPV